MFETCPMKNYDVIIAMLLIVFGVPTRAGENVTGVRSDGEVETLKDYSRRSDNIVLVCCYKMRWIPPSDKFPKGQIVDTGRIVEVIKGKTKVGQKIEFRYIIEMAKNAFYFRESFETCVDGALSFLFFDDTNAAFQENLYKISGDAHWGFELHDPKATILRRQGNEKKNR